MFQTGTSPSSNSYREILTRFVACMTSQHVSAAALNAAGTGYTAGNLLTITHAGGYQPCTIEVLTLGGGGAIATFAIRSNGAFSNRVATVAVNAGGTGYPVSTTVILEIQGGTATERAKVSATTNGSGVVTAVTLLETGGAYTVAPAGTGAATTIVGPSTATTGSGCTINTTMTTLIGTTGAAATGGSGTGATFNLTLTASGWSALWNRNGFSTNGINDEKEVILQGTAGTGTDPLIGFRTYTATSGLSTRYGWLVVGMDNFNAGLSFATMPNVGPNPDPTSNAGICFLLFDNAQTYWFSVRNRRVIAVVKAVGVSITSFTSMHAGLMNPFGTHIESPYPLYLSASTRSFNRLPDAGGVFVTGLSELFHDTANCPAAFRRPSDSAWVTVQNVNVATATTPNVLHPVGGSPDVAGSSAEDNISDNGRLGFDVFSQLGISQQNGGAASQTLMPALGVTDQLLLFPLIVFTNNIDGSGNTLAEHLLRGEVDGAFWIPGTKSDGSAVAPEDSVTIGSVRYRIFPNAHRSERYSFFALAES
jgi:hypothetical protein